MKTLFAVSVSISSAVLAAQAQLAPLIPDSATAPPSARAPAAPALYSIVARGPHHRFWASVTSHTNALGMTTVHTNAYTELATGMHYRQGDAWVEAREEIEVYPGYAAARQGQHQVIFANDLATAGAVDMQTPDGKRLQCHLLGLSYFDAASDRIVLIAEVTNCLGKVLGANQVIYENAFDGLKADVIYTFTQAGLSQDVVLRQRPRAPEEFGLDSRTTRLEVLTEFLDPPSPSKQTTVLKGKSGMELADETLDFGAMRIGDGVAFSLDRDAHPKVFRVAKLWLDLEGRHVLVEEVPVLDVMADLATLPEHEGAALMPSSKTDRMLASAGRQLPARPITKVSTNAMELAQLVRPSSGFVLDFVAMGTSGSNHVFCGDTTYYISGTVNLSGTTTIEGGAVLKFTNSPSAKLSLSGPLVCKTKPFQPGVLTSRNDDTVGQPITGSTGNPTNANGGTFLNFTVGSRFTNVIQYLRFSYAATGISSPPARNSVWHSQFVNCGTGYGYSDDGVASFHNVLFARCGTAVACDGNTLWGEHLTIDGGSLDTSGGALTNSLLTGVTVSGDVSLVNSAQYASASGVYQSIGAGNYYLPAGSTNRNCGATNINPALLGDLRQKTTYPPVVYTNVVISADTTLTPQAQRDTDVIDRGFHYEPIDYLSFCCVTNATLTLTNGVVLGYFNSAGVWLHNGARLVSGATPVQRNYLVHYGLVQEQSVNLNAPYSPSSASAINTWHTDSARNPSAGLRFTTLVAQASVGYILLTGDAGWETSGFDMQDSEVYGAGGTWRHWDPAGSVITLRNNLFRYANLDVWPAGQIATCNTRIERFWRHFPVESSRNRAVNTGESAL